MGIVALPFDPFAALAVAIAGGLYLRALAALRRRGQHVPAAQRAAWWAGLALVGAGLLSPLDRLAESLLAAHMAQHLLIADLAAPFLLLGLRMPVLVFFLPRPLLVALARRRSLRSFFRFLRRPLVAIALYVVVLYGWHLGFMFEAAMRSPALHALQHQSFVVASILVWWAALEPQRRRLRGELWKVGHILGARLAGMFLGMAFLVMRVPAYTGVYGPAASSAYGLAPLEDQQIAGGMMLSLDVIVMLCAAAFFFWRAAADHDRAERDQRAERPAPTVAG